ncbi:MAG: hypothetical protein PVF73_08320 [Bacteroidales bacterium]
MILPDKIKNFLVNTVAGINVHFVRTDECRISLVILKTEKGKLNVLKTHELNDLTSLNEYIDKSIPLWICFTGRSVISRKLNEDPGENYLNHILPNARQTDFAVSHLTNSQGEAFVSALRSENLEKIASEVRDAGYSVLGYSIGPSPVAVLFEYGLSDEQELSVPGYRILQSDNQLSDVQTEEKDPTGHYRIAGESMDNNLLLPFSAAFSYLTDKRGHDTVIAEDIRTDEESFLFKRINRYFIAGSLAFLFLLLLINFFVFNGKRTKNQALSDKLAYYETFFVRRDSLRNEILVKTNLINQVGLKHNTRYGFYSDRIAATVPKGITLNELTINPVQDKVKEGKAIRFRPLIIVRGESQGSIVLNDWIKMLDQYGWVKDIEIIGYEKNNNKGNFTFQIEY